jgi:hypothetical protein
MREALREAARQGHSLTRDTSALPTSPTNVYEQETQLMFAATPRTKMGGKADETAAGKPASEAATNLNSKPAVAGLDSTETDESVVTKVAKGERTTLKSQPRKRILAYAASAAVLVAVAAGVYTFTRNPTLAPAVEPVQQNVQTEPTAPPTSNTGAEHPMKVVIIEDGKEVHPATGATPPTTRQSSPAKTAKPNPDDDVDVDDDDDEVQAGGRNIPPEPPDPNQVPDPRRPGVRVMRPGTPEFEEMMRKAEAQRRAALEARREALEQQKVILRRQRQLQIQERERRRRLLQQQQTQQQP